MGQSSEAGRQAAAVLANQHFIFPVNTSTDVTIHFLTLAGGPNILELPMVQRSRSPYSSLG